MTSVPASLATILLLFVLVEGLAWFLAADAMKSFIIQTPATALARIGLVQAGIALALFVLLMYHIL